MRTSCQSGFRALVVNRAVENGLIVVAKSLVLEVNGLDHPILDRSIVESALRYQAQNFSGLAVILYEDPVIENTKEDFGLFTD